MQITDIKNAVFTNTEHSAIDCEIQIGGGEWLPFTASPEDIEQHGRDIFAAIIESGNVTDYIEPEPLPEPIPQTVTVRQARQWMITHGIMPSQVDALIMSTEDETERELLRNYWEYSTEFQRNHKQLIQLSVLLNLEPEQLDQAFREATKL